MLIYHSNICFPHKLHYVHNSVEGRFVLFKVLHKLLIKLQYPTCLPSLRHCVGELICPLEDGFWGGVGPSCRSGFSIRSSCRSLMRGRKTVPSWAFHRTTDKDSGQPFSCDRTTPALKEEYRVGFCTEGESTVFQCLHLWEYLSAFGIPQWCSIDFINDIATTNELVKVGLTTRCQVKDKDTSPEIPEKKDGKVEA